MIFSSLLFLQYSPIQNPGQPVQINKEEGDGDDPLRKVVISKSNDTEIPFVLELSNEMPGKVDLDDGLVESQQYVYLFNLFLYYLTEY